MSMTVRSSVSYFNFSGIKIPAGYPYIFAAAVIDDDGDDRDVLGTI